jgi:homocysteine S-methyltransferase
MTSIIILDGGMGRELLRLGAPFRQPEWSALALMEAPDTVESVHDSFIAAGASVITTNSYAVVPFHLGEDRFAESGAALAALSGTVARRAATKSQRPIQVAGSLPPALGSYRPDLFQRDRSITIHQVLVSALDPYVDLWLAETQSSIAEATAAREAIGVTAKPVWISYTLDDHTGTLRSGETVGAAVTAAIGFGAAAVLFNCSQPEVMESAIAAARENAPGITLGAYANAFPPQRPSAEANAELSDLRPEITPEHYLDFARRWEAAGVQIIGGCCGIGPAHIAALAAGFGDESGG